MTEQSDAQALDAVSMETAASSVSGVDRDRVEFIKSGVFVVHHCQLWLSVRSGLLPQRADE